jgi:very-short-patch-repair endonuclease
MERLGWSVLRFSATEVVQSPEGIWSAINIALRDRK